MLAYFFKVLKSSHLFQAWILQFGPSGYLQDRMKVSVTCKMHYCIIPLMLIRYAQCSPCSAPVPGRALHKEMSKSAKHILGFFSNTKGK
jgi:hypothetical protein